MAKTAPFKTWFFVLAAVALIAAGAAYLFQLERTRLAPPRSRVSVQIGAARLLVPVPLIRNAERRVDGPAARLDLALTWPEMGALSSTIPAAQGDAPSAAAIFIALEAADTGLDPSQRPKDLYARFLASEVENGPGTLLRRSFKPASPYGGEYLQIAPPDGEIFAARCLAGQSVETSAARCLWQFRYRDIDVQVRFSPDALPNWERLNDAVRQLVQRIYLEG